MHRREFCDAVLQQSESHATDAAGRSEGRNRDVRDPQPHNQTR